MNGRRVILTALFALVCSAAAWNRAHADTASSGSEWAKSSPKPDASLADPLIRHGKVLFDGHCRTCHAAAPSAESRGFYPGTYALEMRYKGSLPAALEQRTDLTAERVTVVVRHGGGGFMPPVRPTELTDDELKAVAAYLSRHRP